MLLSELEHALDAIRGARRAQKIELFSRLYESEPLVLPILTGKYKDQTVLRKPTVRELDKIMVGDSESEINLAQLVPEKNQPYSFDNFVASERQKQFIAQLTRREIKVGLSAKVMFEMVRETGQFETFVFADPPRPVMPSKLSRVALERLFPAVIEKKYDGIRAQIHYSSDKLVMLSREGNDLFKTKLSKNKNLHSAVSRIIARTIPYRIDSVVLDAEVIVLSGGVPGSRGVADVPSATEDTIGLVIFDILGYNDGSFVDLRDHDFIQRRRTLERIIRPSPGGRVRLSEQIDIDYTGGVNFDQELSVRVFELRQSEPFVEGFVLKPLNSKYLPRSGSTWVKIKPFKDAEFGISAFLHGLSESTKDTINRIEVFVDSKEGGEINAGITTIADLELLEGVDVSQPRNYIAKIKFQTISFTDGTPAIRHGVVLDITEIDPERPILKV